MAHFEATVTGSPERLVVALTGDCDLAARDGLISALLSAVDRADLVVVDMSGVEFLDSSGIHALVTAHHAAREAGRRVQLTGAAGAAATVLDLTGLAELLSPADDRPNGRR